MELLETILRENTIACLVNDSGKHFLFVSLLKRLAHRLGKLQTAHGKVALFVASSDYQAGVIAKCIAIHSTFRVNIFREPFIPLHEGCQVVVATAVNACALLDGGLLTPAEIEVAVFDECHLAIDKGSRYLSIAERLCDPLPDTTDMPRILAVTSSILDEQCWNPLELQTLVTTLESIFQARAEVAPELVPSMGLMGSQCLHTLETSGIFTSGGKSQVALVCEDGYPDILDPKVSQSQKLELLIAEGLRQKPKELIVYCDEFFDETGLVETVEEELLYVIEFVDNYPVCLREGGTKDPFHSAKVALNECRHILHELGPWCASAVSKAFTKQLRKLESCEEDEDVKRLLTLAATSLWFINKMVDDYFDKNVNTLEEFMALTSSRVVALIEVLHRQKPDDSFTIVPGNYDNDFTGNVASDDEMTSATTTNQAANVGSDDEEDGVVSHEAWSRGGRAQAAMGCVVFRKDGVPEQDEEEMQCLVFVERKHVAYALNKLIVELCNWDVDLYFVRSHYVATACQTATGADANGTEIQRQEEVMRKFRTKELNLLVSTAALEGGIELPRCNLVIRFTPSTTYKSYVQSKAKARSHQAKFVHLVDPNYRDEFERNFCAFKGIEKILFNRCQHQQKLHSSHALPDPSMADSSQPPYQADPSTGESATVTMTTAIKTINRYCAKLPSDTFTHLAPKCSIEVIEGDEVGSKMFRASLKLPINSPIKRVVKGPLMLSIQLAKMAVALEMSKVLHQSGELDDNLQPVSKDYHPMRKDDDDEDDMEWEEPVGGQGQVARPGSTKRKQYYKKRVAISLQGYLQANRPAYFYAFRMTLTGPITEEQNTRGRAISAPETTSRGFGLLSPNSLQRVPHFPVFTRSGEVTVEVDLVTSDIVLDQSELSRLQTFHRFLFSQVLKLEKSPMHFSPDTAESGCIIVPISRDVNSEIVIDWPFICKVETHPPPTSGSRYKPSYASRTASKSKCTSADPNCSETDNEGKDSDKKDDSANDTKPINGWGELDLKNGVSKTWVTNDDALVEPSALETQRDSNNSPTLSMAKEVQKVKAEPVACKMIGTKSRVCSDVQNKKFCFDEKLFADAVVTPSYRNVDQPQYFYVAEIRRDLSLSSPFPSPELYETFRHYYASKYGLMTTDENQPLLDVDHTSARLNLLTPRYVNQKGVALPITSVENRRAKRESLQQKQILVPELCYVHPFPASLWQKAVCIPTILYRINYLLIADELRIKIAVEACQRSCEEFSKASPTDSGLQFRFAVDGETTSTLAVSRRSGRRTCEDVLQGEAGKIASDANSCDSDSGIESNGDVGTSNLGASEVDSKPPTFSDLCVAEFSYTNHDSFDCHEGDGKEAHESSIIRSDSRDLSSNSSSLDTDSETLGPSPCDVIQTLTMSNANDFFNLERLETIGDSFLKFAITVYLYCTYPGIHEGKLSYLRSIQVSNCNLYRLGRKKGLPECMVASKFEPVENWLPPCYVVGTSDVTNDSLNWRNPGTERSAIEDKAHDKVGRDDTSKNLDKVGTATRNGTGEHSLSNSIEALSTDFENLDLRSLTDSKNSTHHQQIKFEEELKEYIGCDDLEGSASPEKSSQSSSSSQSSRIVIPYNLQIEHSLPDKSIADCVEALIGCYLACADQNTALRLMAWLGLKVLPVARGNNIPRGHEGCPSTSNAQTTNEKHLVPPPSPLLSHMTDPGRELNLHLQGYEEFERLLQYKFKDRSYLLQAFTHASYHCNEVTDCYQRLEFLGDAILDYVITRHLFEDSIEHSPGILTDLRSALVNNNIFAFLAVKWNYHKFLKYIAPQLFVVIERFVSWFESRGEEAIIDDVLEGESWFDESYSQADSEEDIEVPKVLGDIFESVAGAIYLDSGLSLDTVWTVYRRLMDRHIAVFLKKIPKSPVRELLEAEPETAKFEKPERTLDGRFRVTVNIVGKGSFSGTGRNYRIAKTAAAKRALKHLRLLKNVEES